MNIWRPRNPNVTRYNSGVNKVRIEARCRREDDYADPLHAGPWFEDFWIVLKVDRRSVVRIPEPLAPRILADLQALPGFDKETLLRATATVTKARFVCWTRRPAAREAL